MLRCNSCLPLWEMSCTYATVLNLAERHKPRTIAACRSIASIQARMPGRSRAPSSLAKPAGSRLGSQRAKLVERAWLAVCREAVGAEGHVVPTWY